MEIKKKTELQESCKAGNTEKHGWLVWHKYLLISARKTQVFWHQSEARTAATVWNWSGKTLSPGALLAVLYFSSCLIFPPV